MSVAWSRPGSRQACGHPECRRYTRASGAAIAGAVAGLVAVAVTPLGIAHPLPVAAAAFVIAAAGIPLAFWPHPRDDGDLEALIEAVRDHPPPRPLPRRWTGADWAELERELSQ